MRKMPLSPMEKRVLKRMPLQPQTAANIARAVQQDCPNMSFRALHAEVSRALRRLFLRSRVDREGKKYCKRSTHGCV